MLTIALPRSYIDQRIAHEGSAVLDEFISASKERFRALKEHKKNAAAQGGDKANKARSGVDAIGRHPDGDVTVPGSGCTSGGPTAGGVI